MAIEMACQSDAWVQPIGRPWTRRQTGALADTYPGKAPTEFGLEQDIGVLYYDAATDRRSAASPELLVESFGPGWRAGPSERWSHPIARFTPGQRLASSEVKSSCVRRSARTDAGCQIPPSLVDTPSIVSRTPISFSVIPSIRSSLARRDIAALSCRTESVRSFATCAGNHFPRAAESASPSAAAPRSDSD